MRKTNRTVVLISRISDITKTRLFKYLNFSDKKKLYIFHISAQSIDCAYSLEPPRRGGSNEYPQYMFLSKTKKNTVYPCKPQFYYIKVGFMGVKIIQACFRDVIRLTNAAFTLSFRQTF